MIIIHYTDGTWTTLFSTEQLSNPSGSAFYFDYAYDVPNVAFAKDYMYLAVCRAACSSSNGPMLHKISMPGMEVEYPRSAVLNKYFIDNGEPLDYVALGDSFSSGEGVSGFINGTAIATVNECHRSPKAYPMLIDQDVDYDLNLTAFRACSGAKMENITNTGQWGEPKQLSSLSSGTDLVTITIGGNDAEFRDVAFTCNFDHGVTDCLDQLSDSNAIASSQTFIDGIYDTLEAVQDAAPNAGVIVNGYPYILSSPNTVLGQHCGWYAQVASQQEREAMEELVDNLNDALEGAAAQLGMLFVDPRVSFDEHFPCWPDPYLNNADPVNDAYSYHPNEDGQAQYATLLGDWVS